MVFYVFPFFLLIFVFRENVKKIEKKRKKTISNTYANPKRYNVTVIIVDFSTDDNTEYAIGKSHANMQYTAEEKC